MRVRTSPDEASERLAAAVEAVGGRASVVGAVLELSYPDAADLMDENQEQIELTFFLRAWCLSEPDVRIELLG